MRVRITRRWTVQGFPLATLEPGQVFDVPVSIAMYLLALKCAEPIDERLAC